MNLFKCKLPAARTLFISSRIRGAYDGKHSEKQSNREIMV